MIDLEWRLKLKRNILKDAHKLSKRKLKLEKDYYKLLIGRTLVGIFKEGTITTNRILFNLGKEIRLEVTANGIRKIFFTRTSSVLWYDVWRWIYIN
ncbi:MAG: hypothetical protein QXE05_03660 [Nitrososphaeria archaeon]